MGTGVSWSGPGRCPLLVRLDVTARARILGIQFYTRIGIAPGRKRSGRPDL